jgi:TolA-binding protein
MHGRNNKGGKMNKSELIQRNTELLNEWEASCEEVDDLNSRLTQMTGVIEYLEFQLEKARRQNRELQETAMKLDKLRQEKVVPINAPNNRSSKDVLEEAIANARIRGGKHE